MLISSRVHQQDRSATGTPVKGYHASPLVMRARIENAESMARRAERVKKGLEQHLADANERAALAEEEAGQLQVDRPAVLHALGVQLLAC